MITLTDVIDARGVWKAWSVTQYGLAARVQFFTEIVAQADIKVLGKDAIGLMGYSRYPLTYDIAQNNAFREAFMSEYKNEIPDWTDGEIYQALRAAPFLARAEEELAACRLPGGPAKKQTVLALTSRETEVAHLVGKGLSNPEIAAELFISRKAVEYHLSNVYAKCGLQGRQQLRRFVEQWRQPAAI